MLVEAFYEDSTTGVVGDLKVLVLLHHIGASLSAWQQISDVFVINFGVTDSNSDGLVKFCACNGVQLIYGSGQDATVLENGGASSHGVGFPRPSLAVTENGAIISFSSRLYDFACGCFVGFILGSVM